MLVEQDYGLIYPPALVALQPHAAPCELTGAKASPSSAEQIWRCCREDIARPVQLLSQLRYRAVLRSLDGTAMPLTAVAAPLSGVAEGVLAAQIYDPTGEELASFEVTTGDDDLSEVSHGVLRLLVDSAARAITERLFRIHHRRQWILAARREDGPETFLLLALSSDLRVLGADRHGRQMLSAQGLKGEVGLSALFCIDPARLRGRKYCDETLCMLQLDRHASWYALLTPPDANTLASHQGERAVVHTRPRLDTILCVEPVVPERREALGLPPAMLRRIIGYIDTHLDSTLTTEDLAAILKISASHFARSFTTSIGLTPHAYVMKRRLSRAQELLAQTPLPLVEIALSTGFADQSHFCRRFHQMAGMPPRTFRRQLQHI